MNSKQKTVQIFFKRLAEYDRYGGLASGVMAPIIFPAIAVAMTRVFEHGALVAYSLCAVLAVFWYFGWRVLRALAVATNRQELLCFFGTVGWILSFVTLPWAAAKWIFS